MKNGPAAKDILSILTDKSSTQIMKLLDRQELSARVVSSTLNLPLSSTYKKIKKLEQLNLIRITKVMRTLDGMDESFYTLSVKEITITYKNHIFSSDIQQMEFDDKIMRLWQKFKN